LVLPGSRARIVRCGGRYDPQLVKRSSEWVSEWFQGGRNSDCLTLKGAFCTKLWAFSINISFSWQRGLGDASLYRPTCTFVMYVLKSYVMVCFNNAVLTWSKLPTVSSLRGRFTQKCANFRSKFRFFKARCWKSCTGFREIFTAALSYGTMLFWVGRNADDFALKEVLHKNLWSIRRFFERQIRRRCTSDAAAAGNVMIVTRSHVNIIRVSNVVYKLITKASALTTVMHH